MQIYGATLHPSPSKLTQAGRSILAEHPDSPGSLGIAISEAVEAAVSREDTRYALGSVLNHVLLHQTVIGQEALRQLELAEAVPDVIVGCTGGGSNFGGLAFPFLREKLAGRMDPVIRCVEPAACPSLTRGEYRYDFGDAIGMTPLLKMHTLGHGFIPDPIHAGGLRYHGMSPLVSHVYELGLAEAVAIPQLECFEAAIAFARTQGSCPHRSRPTPSRRRSGRPTTARRPASRRRSSPRSAATATSTWVRTRLSSPARWPILSFRRPSFARPWLRCPSSTQSEGPVVRGAGNSSVLARWAASGRADLTVRYRRVGDCGRQIAQRLPRRQRGDLWRVAVERVLVRYAAVGCGHGDEHRALRVPPHGRSCPEMLASDGSREDGRMRFESLYAHGFARVAACTADVYIADPLRNAESVVEVSRRLSDAGVAVAVLPSSP